jgi:hypothetical protein
MEWTVERRGVPLGDLPVFQLYYLGACRTPADPTIVWGTEIRMEAVESFLRQKNATGEVLLSPAHVLLRNVALAMERHPEFNCRVTRRRVFSYHDVNLLVPLFDQGGNEINTLILDNVPAMSLEAVAEFLWASAGSAARGELDSDEKKNWFLRLPRWLVRLGLPLHLWNQNHMNFPRMKMLTRENRASMLVNYFGFRNSPPLKSYKPSRFPLDGMPFSITMGATRDTPVVEDGNVVPGRVASLFLRADHRLVDAFHMRCFLESLDHGFQHPDVLDVSEPQTIDIAA